MIRNKRYKRCIIGIGFLLLAIAFANLSFAGFNFSMNARLNNHETDFIGVINENASRGYDPYDFLATDLPNNYSKLYSTAPGNKQIALFALNSTELPIMINLTYDVSTDESGYLNISWNISDNNKKIMLIDYGYDNNYGVAQRIMYVNNTVNYSVATSGANRYFRLIVRNNTLFRPPWVDSINASANTTSVGIVWNSVSEADYYTVCYSNNIRSSFTNCTNTTTTVFEDQNGSMYERQFYKIYSENDVGNNVSNQIAGKQTYNLGRKDGGTAKNWISLYINSTSIARAHDLLMAIPNITEVGRFNPEIQTIQWCSNFTCPAQGFCTNSTCNFNITIGESYRIVVNTSAPISFNWSLSGIVVNPTQINLVKKGGSTGKNWITVASNTSTTSASLLMTRIGGSVDSINRWNTTTQKWMGWISLRGGRGTNFEVTPSDGYVISVTANTSWRQE